jgi:intracellular sulfur oxidation DsrE/DsrF family protein
LPAKKQTLRAKLKSWQLMAAVVTGISVIAGGVGVFAYQQYTQAQISAVASAENAIELGEQRIAEISDRLDDLELAIRNAEQLAFNTDGQELEDMARENLLAEIEIGKEIWVAQKTKLLELKTAVQTLKSRVVTGTPTGSTLASLLENISKAADSDWDQIVIQIVALGEKITSVQTAQASLQRKMEKLAEEVAAAQAAEAAERLARERNITPTSTLTDSGGSTAPSAPAPPPAAEEILVAPVEEGETNQSFIISYIAALAPNSFVSWVPGLCDGYYVCGRAWVGGLNTTPVRIELDPALEEIYRNQVGLSVLVHEAAHARQWLKYGSNIIAANEAYTGLVGTAAVEYMADCATIVKLGYSTNVYTRTCSASELEAAATIW